MGGSCGKKVPIFAQREGAAEGNAASFRSFIQEAGNPGLTPSPKARNLFIRSYGRFKNTLSR